MKKVLIMTLALLSIRGFSAESYSCEIQNFQLEITEQTLIFQDLKSDEGFSSNDFTLIDEKENGTWVEYFGDEAMLVLHISEDMIRGVYGAEGYQRYLWATLTVGANEYYGHCIHTIKVPDAGPRS